MTEKDTGLSGSAKPQQLLRLLKGLEQTEAGRILFNHIEAVLAAYESENTEKTQAYSAMASALLDVLAARLERGSPQQIQIRLLKSRLQPPLTSAELSELSDQLIGLVKSVETADDNIIMDLDAALEPLIEDLGAPETPEELQYPRRAEDKPEIPVRRADDKPPVPHAGNDLLVDRRVNSAYRLHLNEKREEIQRLQTALAKHVQEARKQNEEFGSLLEVQLRALRQAGNIQKIEHVRQILISEIEKLMHGERTLVHHLDNTNNYLQIIHSDSHQLSEELNRVRLLSLTDELTSLPNRRAFMQRLEDETGRVKRYGYPLSLAIIDLDRFKTINDMRGHTAGDEVLRTYANHVLSVFRHHDLVARYGGEEFAALLPYTDKEGASCALSKVQKRSAEVSYHLNEKSYPLPTFSAGIAIYRPGESSTSFIKRADASLYRAKHLGRNRIETDLGEKREAVVTEFSNNT